MLYQKPLVGISPFRAVVGKRPCCPPHRHCEIELLYALNGGFTAAADGIVYDVSKGDALVVGSMAVHDFRETLEGSSVLVVEVGPFLLGEAFGELARLIYSKCLKGMADNPDFAELNSLLLRVASESAAKDSASVLAVKGGLYDICSQLMRIFADSRKSHGEVGSTKPSVGGLRRLDFADSVLEFIQSNYMRNITLDDAVALTSYSKSSFCKLFKDFCGLGFHEYLNSLRIKNSCYLLRETALSVNEISESVGFNETKSFCRVFRSIVGMTPTEFRNERNR